jgi:hypothetical protein
MSEIQPPPGYTSTPPTEPGWYKVWNRKFDPHPFRMEEVYRPFYVRELHHGNGWKLNGPIDGWFWGPRVEFS